jgi:amino acid permease
MEEKKKLTFFEAASIVTGFGVGGGIMAVPYLASLNGIVPFIIIILVAFFISLLIHLMIAEMTMWDSTTNQIVEYFGKYLFRGRGGSIFTWIFFVLILLAFIANLSAYIAGGGEILRDLLSVPLWLGHAITYLIAAGVVFFGLKAIGISEKYAVLAIILLIAILTIASFWLPYRTVFFASGGGIKRILALFGMIMFSFTALFSVPQAAEGLHWNKKLLPRAIIVGMAINLILVAVISLVAMGVSQEVTRVAITGWGRALGNWAFIFGSLFILLAMLTSYWSISFALAVILKERLAWGDRISWLVATLPTFLVVIIGLTDFLGFMRIAGGAIALLVAILAVPVLRGARKYGDIRDPEWLMGFWGNTLFQIVVIIGFIIMAVGSIVTID